MILSYSKISKIKLFFFKMQKPSEALEKQKENVPVSHSPHLALLNSCVLTPWVQLYPWHLFIYFLMKLNIFQYEERYYNKL